MYLYKKRKVFLLAILVTILTGCGGGSGTSSIEEVPQTAETTLTVGENTVAVPVPTITELASAPTITELASVPTITELASAPTITELASAPTITEPAAVEPLAKSIQQGQITDSVTGEPLANIEVSIGEQTVTTDTQGFYELTYVTVSDRSVITFKHESYCTNSKIISIKQYSDGTTLSANYLETTLDKYDAQNNDDSQNEKWWRYKFGIKIPGGIYIDNEGNDYSGNAITKVAYKDVSTEKGRDVFPGTYEGKNSNGILIPFVSYGFMVIELEDENGVLLDISDDITLTFHSAVGTTAESIPLWYYDYAQGIWIEEGYATRLLDGKYEGIISHPGTWSLSQPIEDATGIYTDRIVYPDGTPVKNLRVHAVGKNWIRTDLSTDENGVFEIKVIPGEEFGLKVYHYSDKYGAKFNGIIAAVASGETIDNID